MRGMCGGRFVRPVERGMECIMRVIDLLNRFVGLAVVGLVCVLLAAPGVSWGQGKDEAAQESKEAGLTRFEEAYIQRFAPRTQLVATVCRLTDKQLETCRTLQEKFAQRLVRSSRTANKYLDFIQSEVAAGTITADEYSDRYRSVSSEYTKYISQISEELKSGLKALMTEEQLVEWEWVEKLWHLYDEGLLTEEYRSGGWNLVMLVSTRLTSTDVSPEMWEVLKRYLAEIDRVQDQFKAAQARYRERSRIESDEALSDAEKSTAIDQLGDFQFDVMSLTLQVSEASLQQLLPLMPELEAVEVELAFHAGSGDFTGVFFPDAGLLCRRVMGLKSMTEEQRAQIREFRLQVARALLAKAKERHLKQHDDDEFRDDKSKREADEREWVKVYSEQLERLRAILTAEQIVEAGPPIDAIALYVPDFESDDEPPHQSAPRPQLNASSEKEAPKVNAMDIAFLSRIAMLSEAQKEAAKNLVSEYQSRYRLAMRKFSTFQASMLMSMLQGGIADSKLMTRAMRVMPDGRRYLDRIRDELMNDLHDLLTEDQLVHWGAFERRIARKSVTLGDAMLGIGREISDLPTMMERAFAYGAVPSEAILEELESYEREVQPLVVEILASRAKLMADIERDLMAEDYDYLSMQSSDEGRVKIRELLGEMGDLTRQYFQKLRAMLEGVPRIVLEEAMYLETRWPPDLAYPGELSARDGSELADDIARLKELTEAQRKRVHEIRNIKQEEIHTVRQQLYEALSVIHMPENDWRGRFEMSHVQPIRSLYDRLNELNDSMVEELRGVLTPEQVGRLPKKWRQQEKVSYPRFDED